MKPHKARRAFLMLLEAASCILLLLFAASFLRLFYLRHASAADFFICSDAALVLAKSHAFSDGTLQQKVEDASLRSGLCISAESPQQSSSSCKGGAPERYSFSIPIWQGGAVQSAQVGCWRQAALEE